MLAIRRAADRGHADHGWLLSHHTFSFADYHDPRHMGFRALRVINDDRVAPARGFGTHGHRDMEIVSYVLDGALEHKDSMGNGSVMRPGDVQRMTAGTGVRHSEYNASKTEPVRFLQIWIFPDRQGLPPGYAQKHFAPEVRRGKLVAIATQSGVGDSVTVSADVAIHAGLFDAGEQATLDLAPGRHAWVQVARGKVTVQGETLEEGDGMALSDVSQVTIAGVDHGEVLVFDLA